MAEEITIRPYQEEAVRTIAAALEQKSAVLIQAPTGSGKTIIVCEIIRRYLSEYPTLKIGIIAHRLELVTQAMEKLLKVWPEGAKSAGYACAGAGKVEVDKRIVIGSIQTLVRRTLKDPFDWLILDEAHRLPGLNKKSSYRQLLVKTLELNPNLRVLGVTATPFRMNHGYIYGSECRHDQNNLFPALDYAIDMNDLINAGYLSPWRAKQPVDIGKELKRVKVKLGDYDSSQLNDILVKDRHMRSVVEAYQLYGEGRKHCLVFAVTIEHAEKLAEFLKENGYKTGIVHSLMDLASRRDVLTKFKDGEINFLANVGVLTEGWDSPHVDLIIMCRPTKSTGLFVQMFGRGSRICPGKKDVLILDMVNNFRTHGDPAHPVVRWKKQKGKEEPPLKHCPECHEIVPLSARACPFCGYEFESDASREEINEAPAMEEVKQTVRRSREMETLSFAMCRHTVKSELNAGKRMLRLIIFFKNKKSVSVYLDIEGVLTMTAYQKAQALWILLTGGSEPPKTVDEACARKQEINLPRVLTVNMSNKFNEIEEFAKAGRQLSRYGIFAQRSA